MKRISIPLPWWSVLPLSALSGALAALSLPTLSITLALFAGLSCIFALAGQLEHRGLRFAQGWLFGFGYHLAGLWWIGNALLVEGNPYRWAWSLGVVGMPILLAFFTALAFAALPRGKSLWTLQGWLGFVAILSIEEWTRGHLFTGFPWNLFGHGLAAHLELLQIVSLIGADGLTLLAIAWATLPALILLHPVMAPTKRGALALVGIASLAAMYGWGALRLSEPQSQADTTRPAAYVRVVQPNLAQADKWNPKKFHDNVAAHLSLSLPAPGEPTAPDATTFVIWPETAIPHVLTDTPNTRAAIAEILSAYPGTAWLLAGALRRDESGGYLNSLLVYDRMGMIRDSYDKSHLVPFGEYMPLQRWIPFGPVSGFKGLQAGDGPRPLSVAPNTPAFGPLICYEVIFSGKVVNADRPRPDWLLTITNDSWYGDSPGPHQHWLQARLRAIEEGLPMVRAATTGISGVIDPKGMVLQEFSLLSRGSGTVPLPSALPATLFSRWGDLIFYITCPICLLVSRLRRNDRG